MFESLSQNFGILRQPVGNNLKNEEGDVLAVKRRLAGERPAPQTQALPQAAENKQQAYDIGIDKGLVRDQLWKQYVSPGKEGQKDAGEYSVKTVDPAFLDRFYKKEMEENNRRFIDSMVKGYVDKDPKKRSPLREQILKLRDGESITLKKDTQAETTDEWDKDVSRTKAFVKSIDEGFGFGAVKIKSIGTLKATRRGDSVEIEGAIDHNLNDIYDFNDDTVFDRAVFDKPRELAKIGKAKPFLSKGTRTQKLKGHLRVKNGQIQESLFGWENMD